MSKSAGAARYRRLGSRRRGARGAPRDSLAASNRSQVRVVRLWFSMSEAAKKTGDTPGWFHGIHPLERVAGVSQVFFQLLTPGDFLR